jgi:hypothetical protein
VNIQCCQLKKKRGKITGFQDGQDKKKRGKTAFFSYPAHPEILLFFRKFAALGGV